MEKTGCEYRLKAGTGGERYFIESHTILNKESNPLIKVTHITLQDEVLLGLR